MTHDTYGVELTTAVNRLFDNSSLVSGVDPKAVILMGGVAVGKTHRRKRDYSRGYVVIDAAEIFHHLSHGDETLNFPEAFEKSLELIGSFVAQRALSERRNFVTELIGTTYGPVKELIISLTAIKYKVEVVSLTCDFQESVRRNENRGDNISAYYAEAFQRTWIINACRVLRKSA